MIFITAFLLSWSLAIAYGSNSNCIDVSGKWQNQLGSNMTLERGSFNQITGEYRTAVESAKGAAATSSRITGTFFPVKDGGLVAFVVAFNNGTSLTTWVGQCLLCGEEEILFTTWTLRSYVPESEKKWMSTLISQDTFRRQKQDGAAVSSLPENKELSYVSKTLSPCDKNTAGAEEKWMSTTGNKLEFYKCFENGVFAGEKFGSPILGRSYRQEKFSSVGFFTTLPSNKVKAWIGHIYQRSHQQNLETVWLEHSFSSSCEEPRNLVQFGMEEFSFLHNDEDSSRETRSILEKIRNYFRSWF